MNSEFEVINRINIAIKEKRSFLDLSGMNISQLPDAIYELENCIEIDLSFNNLINIPMKLFSLKSLQILNLSNNYFSTFDISLNYSYSINKINISNNFIYQLPKISEYYNDIEIEFDYNPFLDFLPDYIADKDLDYIEYYLESLKARKINKQLFEFKLVLVGAGDVGKTSLVKVLKNQNFDIQVGKEDKTNGIEINKIDFNVFFPASATYLNSEPDNYNLYFKPFSTEEMELLVDYEDFDYEDSRTQVFSVWEDLEDDFKVDIEMRNFDSSDFDVKKEVVANVWDFGGQEIYLNTHQFFLTNHSIYLILWDSRKDTESISFDYWLNLLNNLTEDSYLIIVMNKCENGLKTIDEDYYKKKHPNIIDFVNISCYTKEGISKLKGIILETIQKLKRIGDYLPESWEKIRFKIKQIKKNYITYSEFLELCKTNDKIDASKAKIISQYLHDIGDVLHFQNDNYLKTLVIINPEWATKAVYLLFDTLEIQKNKGKFTINDLERFWDLNVYPIEKHNELIHLMQKFEICFKLIGTDYFIIPDFLDYEKQTNDLSKASEEDILRYKIEYKLLPSNLFTRLICRLSYLLKKDDFWKSSAYLLKENSSAYIKFHKDLKSINIHLSGSEKGQMLSVISNELDYIHSTLKMDKENDFKQKYACNCNECSVNENPHYYEKKHLHKALNNNKEQIMCPESTEEIKINDLLNGYKTSNIQTELIYQIFKAVYNLQSIKNTITKDENSRNTYIANQLSNYGVNAKDQSLHGESKTKIKSGELDIKFTDNKNLTFSLFEGVNLTYIDRSVLSDHIEKTIKNYNPTGLNVVFFGVYYEGNNFCQFQKKYVDFLNDKSLMTKFKFKDTKNVTELYNQYGSSIIILKTKYLSHSLIKELTLFHLLIDVSN